MLRGETEEVQRRIRQAILDRDGPELGCKKFSFLRHDLRRDAGTPGRLARIAQRPDESAARRWRLQQLQHFAPCRNGRRKIADLLCPQRFAFVIRQGNHALRFASRNGSRRERLAAFRPIVIGITAGASCPNNLIEETLLRLFELRGITRAQLELAA